MNLKLGLFLAILTVAVGAWEANQYKERQAGYDKCKVEALDANTKALQNKINSLTTELNTANGNLAKEQSKSEGFRARIEELQNERTKYVPPVVIVKKTAPTEHCTTIDADIIRVYNESAAYQSHSLGLLNGE